MIQKREDPPAERPDAWVHIFTQPDGKLTIRGGGKEGTNAHKLMLVVCDALKDAKG